MPSGPDTLLTTREAAARLGLTPGRVRQLVLSGELPAEKRGRDLLLRTADVEAFRRKSTGRPKRMPSP